MPVTIQRSSYGTYHLRVDSGDFTVTKDDIQVIAERAVADGIVKNVNVSQTHSEAKMADRSAGGAGCAVAFYTPGMILAMVISWETNHSIAWAILHGYLSWAYVIYYTLL